MSLLETRWVDCPYCGESVEIVLDLSAGDQQMIEDCWVCCRPMELKVSISALGDLQVSVYRDDD